MTTTHTHEVRFHDYHQGLNHSQILFEGDEYGCKCFLTAEAKKHGVGPGFLTGNDGYSVVNLSEEIIQKKKKIAVELFDTVKELMYVIGSNIDMESETARIKFVKAQNLIKTIEK